MPFGAHETMEVHEILNEKINMINHFSLYVEHAQDPQLKHMINRHLQTVVQGYDQLVAYTHDYNAVQNRPQTYGMPNVQPQHIQYGLRSPAPVGPQMSGRLSDEQIVCAMLLCHKNSAKNHIASSLECADPNVRQMLINGANICANQAYEVFLYMNQQGQYQVPTMQDHTAKTYLHTYQQSGEQMGAMGMSGAYGGMSGGMSGNMSGMPGGMSGMSTGGMSGSMSNAGQQSMSGSSNAMSHQQPPTLQQ